MGLREELLDLRRGAGLHGSPLRERVGPRLAELCGASPADSDAVLRHKLRAMIERAAAEMPRPLRRAAELAFALDPVHSYLLLDRRLDQLCRELSCQPRTARRRSDEAVAWLVRAMAPEPPAAGARPGQSWYLRSFHALLRLDTPTPELYEKRDIVAIQAVDEVTVRFSVPRPLDRADVDGDVFTDVLFGARICDVTRNGAGQCFELTLRLPNRLSPGQAHEVLLHHRFPEHQPLRDHYVFQPLTSCVECVVRIKFPPDRAPAAIWRLDGVPPRALDDPTPGAERLTLDAVGELRLAFLRPEQGHAYGAAWTTLPA